MQTPSHAEEAVLGGLIVNNEAFHDVAPLLSADHFTSPFRRRLWVAIRDRVLAGEEADVITLAEALPDDTSDIFDLAANAYTGRTTPIYAAIIRDNWRRREAAGIAQRLLAGARDAELGAVDAAIADLMALSASMVEHEFTGKQALSMAFTQAEEANRNGGLLPGITTGLRELDSILGGWHDSDLTIIGGRPAMGKTAFLLGLVEAAADTGVPVGLISAEQPTLQIGVRRMALASGVGAAAIRAGNFHEEDWAKLADGMARAKERPMWIYDRSAVTLDELVGVARKWKHQYGIRVLFVDYAQRITVPGADRITEVAAVARGLKNLARDLQIPVVSLAQVVKGVDTRPDKRPTAGDLANSDELTREADQILMLYRDEVYHRDSPDRGIAEILIEKNRHGPTGYKRVAFKGETMRFADPASGMEDYR
ncbi:helicase DnaB [Lysobacter arseniciresistens ZS79]|uniref:DNA 5'-3' helicase n=1 Tax=Lysobacter arseniciresistens ZS79 TaxID=913325 RepID=A0A0A0ETA5_9GAMM|nr:DnaB-like helicase C-terminal domain-containing protein [Lysobacter arseniciresistens]KGM54186.1 helicase DnaB [Lysobacter arseniciresistens ZS79]